MASKKLQGGAARWNETGGTNARLTDWPDGKKFRGKMLPVRGRRIGCANISAMTRFFRALLVWLLVAVLPLQGAAAAVRMPCEAAGFSQVQVRGAMHEGMRFKAHHEAEAPSSSGNEAMTYMEMAAAHPVHVAANIAPHHKAAPCETCGHCCVGACFFPAELSWASTPPQILIRVVAPVSMPAGFIPAGLERPPRQISI